MALLRRVVLLFALGCALGMPASGAQDLVTISVRDADLVDLLTLISAQAHANLVPDATTPHARVTVDLRRVPLRSVLDALESAYRLVEIRRGAYTLIAPRDAMGLDPGLRRTEAFSVAPGSAQTMVSALQVALPVGTILVPSPKGDVLVVSGTEESVTLANRILDGMAARDAQVDPLRTIRLNNILPSIAVQILQGAGDITGATQVTADDARQLLVVRASAAAFARFQRSVAAIDQPVPTVTYFIRVYDLIPSNDSSNVGVQWGGILPGGQVTQGSTFTQFTNRVIPVNATLNALVSQGRAKILERPTLLCTNNVEQKLLIGSQYPITITQSGLVGGTSVQFVQIGVQLSMKPHIGGDGTIVTEMTTTYSAITGRDPVNQYPIIGTRTVTGSASMKDGDALILGGLLEDMDSQTVSKIPLLGNIPIFGEIFKNRQKTSQRDEIVFVIEPHLGATAPEELQRVIR